MNSSFLKFLFISFFFFSIVQISHSSNVHLHHDQDLIANVCKGIVDNSSACLSILRGDPHASSAKSYRELAKFTLEICLRKAIESQNFIKGLLKARENNASVRYCAFESYAAVVGSFSSAYGEVDEDIDTANYDSKIAGDDADECQRELESHGIQIPEIFSRNKDMKLLSSIAYSVTNLVS